MTDQATARPLVSIVVPVFNGERYLRESLDSIVGQTYPNTEVLVMDDASTDGTPEVIASYADRVKAFRQPKNRGIYDNMNDGIAMAQGEYIAIYHADDVYDATIVEREVEYLERNSGAGAVFCKDVFIGPDGRETGRLRLPAEVSGGHPLDFPTIFNALLTHKNRFIRCPSSMVRASVYRDVGAYRQDRYFNTSDLDMYLRISQSYGIGIIEEYLFRYRYGHGNSGQRYQHLRVEPERFFTIMDDYLNDGAETVATGGALASYEGHRSEDWLKIARNLYALGREKEARTALKSVSARRLMRGRGVNRLRTFGLLAALHVLTRLPRSRPLAELLSHR